MVIPLEAGWSDVGSWSALWEIKDQDENGNVVEGDVDLPQDPRLIHTFAKPISNDTRCG